MAEVTPGAVKSLREKTGAGMMECKRALQEAEGNEEQAIEILRKRGMASASKKAGRVAAEGGLNKFYEEAVLLDQPFVKDPAKTVNELLTEKIAKTGERVTVRRFTRYKMGEGLAKRGDDFGGEVAALAGGSQ